MAVIASARLPTSSGRLSLIRCMAAVSTSSGRKFRWPMLRVKVVSRISGPTIRSTSSQPSAMASTNITTPTAIAVCSAKCRRLFTTARLISTPTT